MLSDIYTLFRLFSVICIFLCVVLLYTNFLYMPKQRFLFRFGCQKVCSITFIGKLHKRNMESFSLCNGDKTHESWKPLLNTIHAFRGLSECLHNETWNIFCAIWYYKWTCRPSDIRILLQRMCLGTFSRRARSLATTCIFARVRIIGTLVPFCVIGNSKEFPITQKSCM